jgi:hypothetical protein
MSGTMLNVGRGIQKTSARPIKVMVDRAGEYWICDADVDPSKDFLSQGCASHSDVHLVK